jgi:VanZ family protein
MTDPGARQALLRGPRSWRIAAFAWAAIVVVVGVLPTQGTVKAIAEGHDSLLTSAGHFVEYAILAFVVAVALDDWRTSPRALAGAGVMAACLGALIELIQAPLPYRDCQLSDALTNIVGAGAGLIVFSLAAWMRARRRRSRRG